MFDFEELPEELKLKVLEHFFSEDVPNSQTQNDRYLYLEATKRGHRTRLSLSWLAEPTTSTLPPRPVPDFNQKGVCYIDLMLHPAFRILFTSKAFLHLALPVYIRSTTVEILSIVSNSLLSSLTFSNPRQSLPTCTILNVLSGTRRIAFSTSQLLTITQQVPHLRVFFPSLRSVTLDDVLILLWSRFTSRPSILEHAPSFSTSTAASPSSSSVTSPATPSILSAMSSTPLQECPLALEHPYGSDKDKSSDRDRDVFQPPGIADICGMSRRRVLTEREIEMLTDNSSDSTHNCDGDDSGPLFPGDLSPLCRYISISSDAKHQKEKEIETRNDPSRVQLPSFRSLTMPPLEVYRVVTVMCHCHPLGHEQSNIPAGQGNMIASTEVFIDLTIDVGRVKLIKARVRRPKTEARGAGGDEMV